MAQNEINTRVFVIGGSAGSLNVILKIIPELPVPSRSVFIVVVHRKNDSESILSDLLAARTKLAVREVEDKDPVQTDTIFIAPPDYHLLLEDKENFSLDSAEKVHHSRPSIDVTFSSVAEVFGPDAIGILLSGANADGADGLKDIKERGGLTIVQSPESAEVSYMPQQAMEKFEVDHVLDAEEICGLLRKILDHG